MLFHSTLFGVFFGLVFCGFWALHRWRMPRVIFLLAASYLFYMGWSATFALLIVFQTVSDYFVALWLDGTSRQRLRKFLIWASAIVNLGILALFKYYDFFIDSAAAALTSVGLSMPLPLLHLVLPVGISFYTFHTLSYTLDVYYGRIRATRNFFEFALAVVFFPQLVAGPIVRAAQFLPQLERTPQYRSEMIQSGLLQFFIGLFKKVFIADVLARTLVDGVFSQPGEASGLQLLLGIYAYAFQIYGDFSGYSDMALGAARTLGYELPINFNLPYRATGIRDFWKRWHISLSTFLRDYLYIPLGGSKGGRWFTGRNLMITMLLGGLWHGAAWTFVLWGFYHGILLVAAHFWGARTRIEDAEGEGRLTVRRVLSVLLTFHLVCLGWVFFRAQSMGDIGTILERLVTWSAGTGAAISTFGVWVLLLAMVLHYLPRRLPAAAGDWVLERSPYLQGAMAATALAVIGLVFSGSQPFIYFQF